MNIPICHYPPCKKVKREMLLANETSEFWTFACPCGTIRAVSKPSTRERSLYIKEQHDIEEIRRLQRIRESRRAYSLPSPQGAVN